MNRTNPRTIIHARAPIRVNDIGGWTDTWFSGEGKVLNLAMSPRVEVEVAVFENPSCRQDRAHVHAVDYGDRFRVDPDAPGYDRHPLLQGALNSLPVPHDVDIEVALRSHVPSGCSTGTSASVCVALLGARDRLTGPRRSPVPADPGRPSPRWRTGWRRRSWASRAGSRTSSARPTAASRSFTCGTTRPPT